MAKVQLPAIRYLTLEAIDSAMEAAQDTTPRPYLGMSSVGFACSRKPWLDFRFASETIFKAATLRKFEDGHITESVQADRLRLVKGVRVVTEGSNGKQVGFTDHNGHFRGHMDGGILGLIEAPKTWHVWEHKATEDKKKNVLEKLISQDEKTALELWDDTYFAQAQLYMHYSKMKRHFLTCSSPGARTVISCRTDYQSKVAEELVALAHSIITTDAIPDKISEDPEYFMCKHMCSNGAICHGTDVPRVTCRSCVHASASTSAGTEGEWHCAHHKRFLSVSEQHAACEDHIYLPVLLTKFANVVDADEYDNTITYQNHLNGKQFNNGKHKGHATSAEIFACADKRILGDEDAAAIKDFFDGKIVG